MAEESIDDTARETWRKLIVIVHFMGSKKRKKKFRVIGSYRRLCVILFFIRVLPSNRSGQEKKKRWGVSANSEVGLVTMFSWSANRVRMVDPPRSSDSLFGWPLCRR